MPETATPSRPKRGPRRSRFTPKSNPDPIRLTPRDFAIVRAIGDNRVLSSHQVWQTVGGSKQKVLRRLEALFDRGFVGRPKAQVAQLILNGGQPLHYELRYAGAKLLEQAGFDIRRYQWATKGKTTRTIYIEHTADTAATMLAFRRDAQSQGLSIIEQHDLLPYLPAATQQSKKPFRFSTSVKRAGKNETLAVVPDRLFSILYPDQTRHTGVLERDRDTMPITRPTSHGRKFDHKFETYFEGWKSNDWFAIGNERSVRVQPQKWRRPMSGKSSHKVYVTRGEGEDQWWTRIGSAWPVKGGISIQLDAHPIGDRLVLREVTDEDKEEESKKGSSFRKK